MTTSSTTYVSTEDKQALAEVLQIANKADTARARREAKATAFDLLLTLEPNAVLYAGSMYNGKPWVRTVQDTIDLLKSKM